MKLEKKQKKYLIYGIIVLVILLAVYFKGRAAGLLTKPKQIDIPKDIIGGESGGNTPTGGIETGAEIRSVATALFDDMSGFNWSGHDMTPYKRLLALSNSGFVAVYNDFNTRYYGLGEGTLKEWLMNESFRDNLVTDVIIPRMQTLNLN